MAKKTSSVRMFKILVRAYPIHSAIVLGCLLVSSLAEGFGIATLLPLLNLAVGGGVSNNTELGRTIANILHVVGLEPEIGILLVLIVGLMFFKAGLYLLAMKQVGYTAAHVATDLRLTLISALMRAQWGYFLGHPVGSFANAMTTEAERASTGYVMACRIIAGSIQVAVYIWVALLVSWQVTVAALVVGGLSMFFLGGFITMGRRAGVQQTELLKSVASRMVDGLRGIKPLKAMACEERLEPLLESQTQGLNKAQQKKVLSKEGLTALQEPLVVFSLAIGLYFALKFWTGNLDALMVLVFLFWRTVTRIGSLQSYYQNVASAESAFWSLRTATATAEAAREVAIGTKTPILKHGIYFRNVSFSYGKKKILKDLNLTIPVGAFTALIGPSGAGKTTIADLAIGLLKPLSGDIYIDDMLLSEVRLKDWRNMIGYVPQETILFHDTIHTNVALGDLSLTPANTKSALRAAGAWDFVNALPQKMNTVVGEQGGKLSGGQRQRIALARALIRKPKVLILDEATTGLDPKTEAAILDTLKQLMSKDLTILAISHQPTLVKAADIVYRLDDGTVYEEQIATESLQAEVTP